MVNIQIPFKLIWILINSNNIMDHFVKIVQKIVNVAKINMIVIFAIVILLKLIKCNQMDIKVRYV